MVELVCRSHRAHVGIRGMLAPAQLWVQPRFLSVHTAVAPALLQVPHTAVPRPVLPCLLCPARFFGGMGMGGGRRPGGVHVVFGGGFPGMPGMTFGFGGMGGRGGGPRRGHAMPPGGSGHLLATVCITVT